MTAPSHRETLTMRITVEDEDAHDLDSLVPVGSDMDAGVTMTNGNPVLLVQVRNVAGVGVVDLRTLVLVAGATLLAKRP